MDGCRVTDVEIADFENHLRLEERAGSTIEKYLRDIRGFAAWLGGESVTKERMLEWKEHLRAESYAAATVNSMLTAVNTFLAFCGWTECKVKTLRIQRRMFRSAERDLTRQEYERLVETAERSGKERLALLMETVCATGIRVSEVAYITVEAARERSVDISLKGEGDEQHRQPR